MFFRTLSSHLSIHLFTVFQKCLTEIFLIIEIINRQKTFNSTTVNDVRKQTHMPSYKIQMQTKLHSFYIVMLSHSATVTKGSQNHSFTCL